ncbi:MAG: hypothetical protein MZV63_30825 [Marinilabiliales bacterium]|nr:hypothetical protein [Marinilabiliales bacterium]
MSSWGRPSFPAKVTIGPALRPAQSPVHHPHPKGTLAIDEQRCELAVIQAFFDSDGQAFTG